MRADISSTCGYNIGMENKGGTLNQLTLFGTDAENNIVSFNRVTTEISDVQKFIAALVTEMMTPEEFKRAMDFLFDEE